MAISPRLKVVADELTTPPVAVALTEADPVQDGQFSTKKLALFGAGIVAVFIFGIGIWAAFAPLSGAILAPGKFVVEGQWKVVEAPKTALITELLVSEGQSVKAGQLLLRLDATQEKADFESLRLRFLGLAAERAKLMAEEQALESIDFPPVLTDRSDPDVRAAVSVQESDFRSRRLSLEATLGRLRSQLEVIEEELTALQSLGEEGLVGRARLYPLRFSLAELRGQEIEVQLKAKEQRSAEQREVEAELAGITPKLIAAKAALKQMDIMATASGTVLGLSEFTVGGMVTAGENILNIVPSDADLIVEAAVRPDDIDDLMPGMEASVQITALQRRTTPSVKGVVDYVAADRITTADADYYAVKLKVDGSELRALGDGFRVYPGMPVEVMITTHERTVLDYVFQPFSDSVRKSFREP